MYCEYHNLAHKLLLAKVLSHCTAPGSTSIRKYMGQKWLMSMRSIEEISLHLLISCQTPFKIPAVRLLTTSHTNTAKAVNCRILTKTSYQWDSGKLLKASEIHSTIWEEYRRDFRRLDINVLGLITKVCEWTMWKNINSQYGFIFGFCLRFSGVTLLTCL